MRADVIKLMTWNIRSGGGKRLPQIAHRIRFHAPDIMVLTEYREHARGQAFRATLAAAGWRHQTASQTDSHKNGLLIAAKIPFRPFQAETDIPDAPQRLIGAEFMSFRLMGVYMPIGRKKRPHWDFVKIQAAANPQERFVFIGDFNTGAPGVDEARATLFAGECIGQLSDLGWEDAWRYLNPNKREGTWVNPRSNNWFRIDHAFLSPLLLGDLQDAWLSHDERKGPLASSDHSAYLLTLLGKESAIG